MHRHEQILLTRYYLKSVAKLQLHIRYSSGDNITPGKSMNELTLVVVKDEPTQGWISICP